LPTRGRDMCGRYYLEEEIGDERLAEQVRQATRIAQKLEVKLKTSGEICPTDIAPVIAPSSLHRKTGAFPMRWGFTHPTRGMLVFNTRMETAPEKDMFVGSVNDRRCLVPASCYFEWKKLKGNKKQRYAFSAGDGTSLLLAGLYIRTSDERRLPCFTILTREAEGEARSLHPRMPVIVPADLAEAWLSPDTDFHEFVYSLHASVTAQAR